jgi:hypothetical protein
MEEIIHDPKFESGRRVKKKELERLFREKEELFIRAIQKMACECHWPYDDGINLRNMGDASTEIQGHEVSEVFPLS